MAKRKVLSDEDAFWERIRENLEDHAPKLVTADWYEENGNLMFAHVLRWSVVHNRIPMKRSNGYGWSYFSTNCGQWANLPLREIPRKHYLPVGYSYYTGSQGNTKLPDAYRRLIPVFEKLAPTFVMPINLSSLYDKKIEIVETTSTQSLEGNQ